VREFSAVAASVGKDMGSFAWCAQRRLSLGSTRAEAEENVAWMAREQGDMWKFAGYMYGQGEAGTETQLGMTTVGTPDAIRDGVGEFVAAGANQVDVTFIYPTYASLVRQVHLFAEEVIPAFR
jgi:alkanesulfonate monooxygenase SsuD/methylene tetrahydromethanopterin reductase-like flavin-dependent oxidoreductase (luciferase family)